MTEDLLVDQSGAILTVTFNRPKQRNAMTWDMYQGLQEACERADADEQIRVLVLRGAGGEAFVAGTDIGQFTEFDGPRGVEYEHQISTILGRLAAVNIPVVAAVEGFCIGGGLGLASVADIRICNPSAQFGVPIARTLGNCLSIGTLSVLSELLGRSRTSDLLLTARLMPAEEAVQCGYVTTVTDDVDGELAKITGRLTNNAPLTMWAIKEGLRRLNGANEVDDEDIVKTVYGSEDFSNAVHAFLNKRKPQWAGR
ncbi:enoyl-CoA hydratase/isomerase family protein [Arthrobacter sp. H14]|uniref:enoyl-CoA hydratase/isomerase family protein n=1 Tax=Arthrobacter sp. H14 TaxID=1312959 RepID=UPI00047A0C08|nr:enoyl-CoA hydratase/isomerase family protein [Arthrobacter sp. H14]